MTGIMDVVLVIVGAILTIAAAVAIFRIVKGPSILDRVMGIDVLLAIVCAGIIADMAVRKHQDNMTLVVIISLVGFIGSVAVARYVIDRRPHEH
ncbi:monovalent cation/H+ antiporter complex subunit F [Arthrobacter crystallopoietes]|jgi:multicomponent Na+:H+ antiporter subunit F|uniref:monovalent cation/H+ antiporter complex subunit F n=1 Tax=Micrococcaceae TaxID=1268 RepID=UPI0021C5C60E|nr:monovalent cation/H+ antiporter complex subunit F [Arthrobacter sp. Marseille-P9274]